MPKHFSRLVEPFAGMAAISIATAIQNKSDAYVLNDINEDIIGILQMAIESPEELYSEYNKIWSEQFSYSEGSVNHFYKIRDEYNKGDKSTAKMLYLLARCVKGSVRYGNQGNFNQSPDKRRNGTSPSTLKQNIDAISFYLKGRTTFFSSDYRDILHMTKRGDIVYMDPPYQGTSNVRDNRYISGIDFDGFVESIEYLNSKGIDYIISYDGSCGEKKYGRNLPDSLGLKKLTLNAGLSSQSILLGKRETTFESLYLSQNLQQNMSGYAQYRQELIQESLFDHVAL